MAEFMEYVGWTRAIVALILTLFGVGASVFTWAHFRMKKVAEDVSSKQKGSHAETVNRVGQLEDRVVVLSNDVGQVRREVHQVGERVSTVERNMETVARQSDVAALAREVSGLKSAFDLQTNTLTNQINMLFRKAMGGKEDG